MTGTLNNLAFTSDCDIMELLWENGQVVVRGASTRAPKGPSCISFSSLTTDAQEKLGGEDLNTQGARYESMDAVLGGSSLLGPPDSKELEKHDMVDPYLKHPHTDSLQDAYHPELLPASFEANLNALNEHNGATITGKSNCNDKQLMDSHIFSINNNNFNLKQVDSSKFVEEEVQLARTRSGQLYEPCLQQCRASTPFIRSQDSDFICSDANNSHPHVSGSPNQALAPMDGLQKLNMQEEPRPSKTMSLMNFSYFLRPAALVKASIESIVAARPMICPDLSRVEELKSDDERSRAGTSNPIESTPIKSPSSPKIDTSFQNQPIPMATKGELITSIAKPSKDPFPDEHSEAVCHEVSSKKNGTSYQVPGQASIWAAKRANGKHDTEKSIEPLVACSSACSRGASNDLTHSLKRKYQDTEDSEYLSENVEEEEPEDETKAVPARGRSGAKRSRTAEVHNLSERRRRDKINKKMRALRELIPNCNKADKASMLDEAIEYLKTLQLQLQIMSMRTGLMAPIMLPCGMQGIHVPHLTHFSPFGAGMGMRIGIGAGCGPSQFHSCPISTVSSLPGVAGTTLQMLGLPSQLLPMSMSHAPFIPLPGGPSTPPVPLVNVTGALSMVEHPTPAPTSSSNLIQNINLEMLRNTNVQWSNNQTSCQVTKDGFKHSAAVKRNG